VILIITHKQDFTADFVIEKLNNRGVKYYRFNCEDIASIDYSFENKGNFTLSINELNKYKSVWFRRTKLPDIVMTNDSEKLFVLSDYDSLFDNVFANINTERWLSKPKFVYEAENKLLQLKIASEIGFKVPNTIVTQSKKRLNKFISDNNNNIIIKPIRQGRIKTNNSFKTVFTNKISNEIIDKLDDFDLTPCIFQEYIEKKYELRVTVVNDKVFSAKVDSQSLTETSIDWRKKKIPFVNYELPAEIALKCVEILKKLNLSFGAIDLIKDINDNYIFLEINPNGQWAWIEMETGLPISEEIINYLTAKS
jgi:glutathione synthase/RimK-type ligase-like ATP-grasp enzyme